MWELWSKGKDAVVLFEPDRAPLNKAGWRERAQAQTPGFLRNLAAQWQLTCSAKAEHTFTKRSV